MMSSLWPGWRSVESEYRALERAFLAPAEAASSRRKRGEHEITADAPGALLPPVPCPPSSRPPLPACAHLLGVCLGGPGQIWRRKGFVARPETHRPLPSLPQVQKPRFLRPSPLRRGKDRRTREHVYHHCAVFPAAAFAVPAGAELRPSPSSLRAGGQAHYAALPAEEQAQHDAHEQPWLPLSRSWRKSMAATAECISKRWPSSIRTRRSTPCPAACGAIIPFPILIARYSVVRAPLTHVMRLTSEQIDTLQISSPPTA